MEKEIDQAITVALIGDTGVGKSSILLKFVDNIYNKRIEITNCVDLKMKTIDLNDLKIKLQIWDTSGQERYKTKVSQFFSKSEGFIAVFDVNYAKSFHSLSYWINSLESLAPDRKSVFIVGNKPDLIASREVSYDDAKRFADRNGANYIEVSPLTGLHVKVLFRLIAMEIVSKSAKFIKRFE